MNPCLPTSTLPVVFSCEVIKIILSGVECNKLNGGVIKIILSGVECNKQNGHTIDNYGRNIRVHTNHTLNQQDRERDTKYEETLGGFIV